MIAAVLALALALAVSPDAARVDERPGARVPLDLAFRDTEGRPTRLRDVVRGDRPVLLVLAYERCPMLCGLVLDGVAKAAAGVPPGIAYAGLTVSIDPEEAPAAAAGKRETLEARAGHAWTFLVGPASSQLADAVGFRYARDPETGELAHPACAIVLTPDGRVSRYLLGVDWTARDLQLALVEAGEGRAGTTVQRALLRCWRWDDAKHRYALATDRFVKAGGALTFVVVAAFVGRLWARELGRG